MKLLLHVCCAPCAIFTIKQAKLDGYDSITGLFYNPNIHPSSEFNRREKTAADYFKEQGLAFFPLNYAPEIFFRKIRDFDSMSNRCGECWRLRMGETARFAKDNGFEAFTTTLLSSPYQNHEAIISICEEESRKSGVKFYCRDFRDGFRQAHIEAKEKGLYLQNYCGCVFSMVERFDKSKIKNQAANVHIKV